MTQPQNTQNPTQTPKSPKSRIFGVKIYGIDKFGRRYWIDVEDELLDKLYDLLLRIVGINDVIKTVVIYGESDTGEPYRIVIKW